MLFRTLLFLSLLSSFSFSEGIFDFWSSEPTNQMQNNNRKADLDMNMDVVNQTLKVQRDKTIIEFIPSIVYGYSKLDIDYNNSSNRTETIDSKVGFGLSLNTAFNYFENTKFGYMINFNYESYNFDEDEISGNVQTNISGTIFKVAPIVFYSFDINKVSIYAGLGFGLSKFDLKGTNNFNEAITIDDFSTLSAYKLELLYGRYIVTVLQENMSVDNNELSEIHLSLGYLISF